jgi:hypothetical protein
MFTLSRHVPEDGRGILQSRLDSGSASGQLCKLDSTSWAKPTEPSAHSSTHDRCLSSRSSGSARDRGTDARSGRWVCVVIVGEGCKPTACSFEGFVVPGTVERS